MPLSEGVVDLETEIKDAFMKQLNDTKDENKTNADLDPEKMIEDLAKAISDAVHKYVQTIQIDVTVVGLKTAGSAAAQTQVDPVNGTVTVS